MVLDEYYELLGVRRGASKETLRRAFRARVSAAHPDLHRQDPIATERTRKIIEAYHTLTDAASGGRAGVRHGKTAAPAAVARPSRRAYKHTAPHPVAALLIFLVMCFSVLIVADAVLGNRNRVYRPFLGAMEFASEPVQVCEVIHPNVTDSLEWYYARECDVTFGDAQTRLRAAAVFEEAARRAEARGDSRAASFYADAASDVTAGPFECHDSVSQTAF